MCIYVTIVIHLFLGWITQDSWIPDPFFTVNLKRIDRALHGSDSKVYDQKGELVISQLVNTLRMTSREYFSTLMTPEDIKLDDAYLTFWEGSSTMRIYLLYLGWRMTQKNWDAWDFFGWWANKIEWFFVYALLADKGRVKWRDIIGVYDGSIFYEIEREREKRR